ncbi:hypothetical protein HII31_08883 [Pseudocercospora fuligena]|uniref:Heterokaryon incompatibility domain-containing protein n=1 Tax=Pseudocercospora fuligena TaxID=685502 RepID=A0A8H6RES6_9PEZI|nr:hypothetical protein HII31_08883 [Pseudocercospora fuligena]
MSNSTQLASSSESQSHRDGFGRKEHFPVDERFNWFFHYRDGRLKRMRIQHADALGDRTALLLYTVAHLMPRAGRPWYRDPRAIALCIPGSIAVLLLLFWPARLDGKVRNHGNYDPVRYQHWGYPRVARNPKENASVAIREPNDDEVPLLAHGHSPGDIELASDPSHAELNNSWKATGSLGSQHSMPGDSGTIQRSLFPRYLCFPIDTTDDHGAKSFAYQTLSVEQWMEVSGEHVPPAFVFVSYTRLQFLDIKTATKRNLAHLQSHRPLLQSAIDATRQAQVPAFWIDFECVQDDRALDAADGTQADAFRICDIVTAAHSMAIILGPSLDNPREDFCNATKARWFAQWGQRLWTVPEALLCPSEHRISIYTVGSPGSPELVAKRNLPQRSWPEDAGNMRQLIDHYEGTIHLTQLELISIALSCMQRRLPGTTQLNPGDVSYALMGLLRRRPIVDTNDSDFEAFARLSLANDSDRLMERLLCMQPVNSTAQWHDTRDAWTMQLWDFEPSCQIAGIVDNRTVLLDGAYGATIRWSKLKKVESDKVWLIAAVSLLIAGAQSNLSNSTFAGGVALFAIVMVFNLTTPALIWRLYRGKMWSTQAFFFGMEGIPNLGEVERCMFGFNDNRLKWSPSGSTLSRHHLDLSDQERIADPPQLANNAPITASGKLLKVYTIVDTFTLTATAFYAERPPSVVMICGREGGMQRAVLCSYDFVTQTFVRETIVRMKTLVLDRMSRVDQFRFCLTRNGWSAKE